MEQRTWVNVKPISLSEMEDMKSPPLIGVSLLIFGGVLGSAGLWKLLQPDEFRAVASVQVSEPPPTDSGSYFLLTEFAVLQSDRVLTNAAASLNLNERWGKKYNHGQRLSDPQAEERIKSHLELQNLRNTDVIEIITYDDDPDEAAQLANAIARSYDQFRREEG